MEPCDMRMGFNGLAAAATERLSQELEAIKSSPRKATALQIDETTADYLDTGHGSVRTGYLWGYHNPATGECYYDSKAIRQGGDFGTLTVVAHDWHISGLGGFSTAVSWIREIPANRMARPAHGLSTITALVASGVLLWF